MSGNPSSCGRLTLTWNGLASLAVQVRTLGDNGTLEVRLWRFLRKLIGHESPDEHERKLRSSGLLKTLHYRATRSFEVQMYEDEGRHLFIELADGGVLYLAGQYLFDYGIDPAAGSEVLPDTFPTTEFGVTVHREHGYVFRLEPSGRPLPPVETLPAFSPQDYGCGRVPEDLDVITTHSFDQLLKSQGRLEGHDDCAL